MEWIETTGETIQDARDRALDGLGIAFNDAEIVVVEEPKKGFLGMGKTEARVRARVKPTRPPEKVDGRDRGRNRTRGNSNSRSGGNKSQNRSQGNRERGQGNGSNDRSGKGNGSNKSNNKQQDSKDGSSRDGGNKPSNRDNANKKNGSNRSKSTESQKASSGNRQAKEKAPMEKTGPVMDAAEQADVVRDFLEGLTNAFGLQGDVVPVQLDDTSYEVQVNGADLGLMIGPKGGTLQSIQEIARTAVQQEADGNLEGRVHVDIGSYRAKRREALTEFAVRLADDVKESGNNKVLQPMSASDRKVIHDALTDIEGVVTTSEGREPSRYIEISATN
jgi:spoIIIJ-associated protein